MRGDRSEHPVSGVVPGRGAGEQEIEGEISAHLIDGPRVDGVFCRLRAGRLIQVKRHIERSPRVSLNLVDAL